MAHPTLSRPIKNDSVKELQRLLNRIGALLVDDGDFGPGTERAVKAAQEQAGLNAYGVAEVATWSWLEAQPEPSPEIPTAAVTFIVREEVGSRRTYERGTAFPHFPGEKSGITIGIGYDLRFQDTDFEGDWAGELSADQIGLLRPHLGKPGSSAAAAALHSIEVPFAAAWRVFAKNTLPRYVGRTRRAFPGFDDLPPLCRGVLTSLVYNRGAGMDGERRAEMRAIRDHLRDGRPSQVAAELRSMKRLWPDSRGLRGRRDREAELWLEGLQGPAATV